MHYQISRLFHRSLIKFLSGKQDIGVSIANEVATFINCNIFINKACYRNNIIEFLKVFNEQYKLPLEYLAILCELIEELDEKLSVNQVNESQVVELIIMKYRGTQMFEDIKNSSDWQSVDKVSKGWSSDSKYFIKTKEGKMLLLRISDIEQYETKKKNMRL